MPVRCTNEVWTKGDAAYQTRSFDGGAHTKAWLNETHIYFLGVTYMVRVEYV
jgi:hypothetical protein